MSAPRVRNVLFLCTGNTARSIMAEALLRHRGGDRFQAFSAGSHPKGRVHSLTLETLQRAGVPTDGLRSKSWDEFAEGVGPPLDVVITVCGKAAGEQCPYWPGHPATAHWGVDDPGDAEGSHEAQRRAFERAFRLLDARIGRLTSLPVESLDAAGLRRELASIGETTLDG
jgi:arsenate reductase (thioredoxin)